MQHLLVLGNVNRKYPVLGVDELLMCGCIPIMGLLCRKIFRNLVFMERKEEKLCLDIVIL